MYNFLDYKLRPQVSADCPATDEYEVNNLISANISKRNKGFLAYSAIKPPINIDFEFICPVNIYYILIWTSLGSQKSSGVEFLLKNCNSDFCSISKVYTDDAGIVLYNRKYYTLVKKIIPKDFSERFCQSNKYKFITCAEKLRVRILRTNSSVPCIEKIEVWGDLSRICSDITKKTIKQLYYSDENKRSSSGLHTDSCSSSTSKKDEHLLDIPEEFIDLISCEIMALPMTLPSGKTVDNMTLEKYQESEAKWGRSPSDPFTGQRFTATRKPVLNTALKSRIDDFLLKNAHREETFHIQRTVGSKVPSVTNNISNNECSNTLNSNVQSSSSNLDALVNNAMKQYNIVRFSSGNIESLQKNVIKFCGSCRSEVTLYLLKCEHFICRSCLLKISEAHCKICEKLICRYSIKKYHNL